MTESMWALVLAVLLGLSTAFVPPVPLQTVSVSPLSRAAILENE